MDREEIEDYFFPCNRWLARDEDDREIVRELLAYDLDGRPISGLEGQFPGSSIPANEKDLLKKLSFSEVPYEVRVYTGNKSGAGTGKSSPDMNLEQVELLTKGLWLFKTPTFL